MDRNHSSEINSQSAIPKALSFMQPEDSLSTPQQSTICPDPEPE
jgi:hypothetical protein